MILVEIYQRNGASNSSWGQRNNMWVKWNTALHTGWTESTAGPGSVVGLLVLVRLIRGLATLNRNGLLELWYCCCGWWGDNVDSMTNGFFDGVARSAGIGEFRNGLWTDSGTVFFSNVPLSVCWKCVIVTGVRGTTPTAATSLLFSLLLEGLTVRLLRLASKPKEWVAAVGSAVGSGLTDGVLRAGAVVLGVGLVSGAETGDCWHGSTVKVKVSPPFGEQNNNRTSLTMATIQARRQTTITHTSTITFQNYFSFFF